MMKRLFTLFTLLMLIACATTTPTSTPSSTAVPTQEVTAMPKLRYLALGDSYTIGQSVAEKERWSYQLAGLLAENSIQTDVTIIARTGWTVDELWQGIQADPPIGTYDLVTLLIGVNDQYRGYPLDGYREDFRFMLGKAIEYAGGDPKHVVVLSIPDWGVTPFAGGQGSQHIAVEIDNFNAVNRDETEKAGANYIDITPISREATNDPSLIADDGLHPSGKMYALWAEQTLPIVLKILKDK